MRGPMLVHGAFWPALGPSRGLDAKRFSTPQRRRARACPEWHAPTYHNHVTQYQVPNITSPMSRTQCQVPSGPRQAAGPFGVLFLSAVGPSLSARFSAKLLTRTAPLAAPEPHARAPRRHHRRVAHAERPRLPLQGPHPPSRLTSTLPVAFHAPAAVRPGPGRSASMCVPRPAGTRAHTRWEARRAPGGAMRTRASASEAVPGAASRRSASPR